jgi:hypothetical protein
MDADSIRLFLGQNMNTELAIAIEEMSKHEITIFMLELLSQAREQGATNTEVTSLENLLELFFKHPDRYQRIPDLSSVRRTGNTSPLPYEGE